MTSDIFPRGDGKSTDGKKTPNAQPEKPNLDGIWFANQQITTSVGISFMKIANGAIVRLSPMPFSQDAAEVLFKNRGWYRETHLMEMSDDGLVPKEMTKGFDWSTSRFPYGCLITESIEYESGNSGPHPTILPIKAQFTEERMAPPGLMVHLGVPTDLWEKKVTGPPRSYPT